MPDEDENEYYETMPFPEKIVMQELNNFIEIIYECKSLLDTKLDNYCSRILGDSLIKLGLSTLNNVVK